MLGDKDAVATVAVKDIEVARQFYGRTLGLKETPTGQPSVLGYRSGNASIMVYQSEYAGTNKATAVTWIVGDQISEIVRALAEKGVVFERYDFSGTTHEGAVHVMGTVKVAWLKDPDGNILSIVNGSAR